MRIEIRKFGDILTSRPAGREAALAMKAYFKPGPTEIVELDFADVLAVGPSWLDEVLSALRNEFGADRVICLPSDNLSVRQSLDVIDQQRGDQRT